MERLRPGLESGTTRLRDSHRLRQASGGASSAARNRPTKRPPSSRGRRHPCGGEDSPPRPLDGPTAPDPRPLTPDPCLAENWELTLANSRRMTNHGGSARTPGISRFSPIAWHGSKTPAACPDTIVHPVRGTPHPSPIRPLVRSEKCSGVWGRDPQEQREVRRRRTECGIEISKASPEFPTLF